MVNEAHLPDPDVMRAAFNRLGLPTADLPDEIVGDLYQSLMGAIQADDFGVQRCVCDRSSV
jgi:hypothetical protein